jgi:hypothetical protein
LRQEGSISKRLQKASLQQGMILWCVISFVMKRMYQIKSSHNSSNVALSFLGFPAALLVFSL